MNKAKKTTVALSLAAAVIATAVSLSQPKAPRCVTILDADGNALNTAIFDPSWTDEQIAAHQRVNVADLVETPEGSHKGEQYDKQAKKFILKVTGLDSLKP